jgi:hypothetical protein
MSNDDYEVQSSRAITTRGFQTDPIFMDQEGGRAELAKMQKKAIIDAVAEQIVQRKGRLATQLGHELTQQVQILFLEELEACEPLFKRAERLSNQHARKRYTAFLLNLWDQYEAFLIYTAMDCNRNMSQIAVRSPYPDPEVQRNWLQRMFRGS